MQRRSSSSVARLGAMARCGGAAVSAVGSMGFAGGRREAGRRAGGGKFQRGSWGCARGPLRFARARLVKQNCITKCPILHVKQIWSKFCIYIICWSIILNQSDVNFNLFYHGGIFHRLLEMLL